LKSRGFFLATVYLPLADVITYYLACPIFVTALSPLVLREHVGWRRWSAVVIGFCGVLIALRPSSQTVSWPALIALGGSLSFALLMLITRSLRRTPDIVLASSQFAGTFTLGALMSPFGWVTPSVSSLGLFAAAGCISVAALLCVNRSLKLAPASVVVPYQYSMIVWAVMFGYLVFGDVPQAATIAVRRSSSARAFTFSCANAISDVGKRWLARRWLDGNPVIARSEATKQSSFLRFHWIASLRSQ
jgi:drug/metabolite transporter (DMT)-like permease